MANKKSPYEVNPTAENVLDTVLKVFLVIGLVGAAITVIVAIGISDKWNEWAPLKALLPIAVFTAVAVFILWAVGKVMINISRNLYNINDALRGGAVEGAAEDVKEDTVQEAVVQEPVQEDVEEDVKEDKEAPSEPELVGTFKKGQLVMIKTSRVKFCIDKLVEEDGQIKYYCSRLFTAYSEDQLEPYND